MKNTLKYLQNILTKSKKTHQELTENTLSNGEKTHNNDSSEQVELNEEIPYTPFRVVGNKEKGYFIALGLHRLTEYQKTQEQAIQLLDNNMWLIIANMMVTIIQQNEELNKQKIK